ncbi:transporter [Dyella tabacisoli]|uniref:Transporter n=1 Tax=Dyella tabacisoli TaxID=2282381 RepID=A0A369URL8_9GAMM|nr:transporter [Dyella tabacisoli]RDD83404.1 transporter [Dyella tabacisoli]
MDFNGYGRRHRRFRALCAISLALAACCHPADSLADDAPSYDRPGFGFAPNVLKRGGFAYEQGLPSWSLSHDAGVRSSQYMTDSLLRLGLGSGLELQLGGAPYVRQRQSGDGGDQVSEGRGDSTLGFKLALPSHSQDWSWGALGTVEFTDGARGIRNPQRQYTLGLDIEQQWDERHAVNYVAQWQRSGNSNSYQLAGNYGYALTRRWGVYGEAVVQHAQGGNSSRLGAGLTWLPNERLQWDTWCRHRISGRTPDWEAGVGVAMYFGP